MNAVDQAKSTLSRIQSERIENEQAIRNEHDRIPFGQPNIEGRGDIYKTIKRHYEKGRKLAEQEAKQSDRVEMFEKVEEFKKDHDLLQDVHVVGKSSYATVGVKTSVDNLDYFKNQLKDLETKNDEAKAYNKTKPDRKAKTYGTDITKLKRKISSLEEMQKKDQCKTLSVKTQKLIKSEAVKQWKNKPIFYFVKGLKKVALEINESGDFYISNRYPAYTEADQKFVEELLCK